MGIKTGAKLYSDKQKTKLLSKEAEEETGSLISKLQEWWTSIFGS